MNPPLVVEVDIVTQDATQVALVQNDDIVQTLPAQGPEQSLGVGILPR